MNTGVQILKNFGKINDHLNLWKYSSPSFFSSSIFPQHIQVKSSLILSPKLAVVKVTNEVTDNPCVAKPCGRSFGLILLTSLQQLLRWPLVYPRLIIFTLEFHDATVLVLLIPHWLFLLSFLCCFFLTSPTPNVGLPLSSVL